jgi:hypothetical protein
MNAHLSPEERSLYPLLAYTLLWPLLYALGTRHLAPPALGSALAGFVWMMGWWFIPPRAQRRRFTFVRWLAISATFALVAFTLRFAIDLLWPE